MEKVKVFAPATVANVGSGFDILGLALEAPGDIIEMWKSTEKGVHIKEIVSEKQLSTIPEKNTAGMALLSMLKKADADFGVNLKIHKGVNPGSGTGSSAASAAGAVFALNQLLKNKFSDKELVSFAMDGEIVASGTRHADNVAPCLLGNFTLIRQNSPLDIITIKSPDELYLIVIHPEIEIKTSDSRAILKKQVPLNIAVKQWGNVAGLIAGLYTSDYDLIGRSIEDYIVTPGRSILIPMYEEIKLCALKNGALAFSISGSGPSMFAMCKGNKKAKKIESELISFLSESELQFNIYKSKVASEGCRIIY